MIAYLFEHAFPVLNFVALVFVLIRIQYIRADLRARLQRFEQIDVELEAHRFVLRDCPVLHDIKVGKPTP